MKPKEALKQVLEKYNRIQYFKDQGLSSATRPVTCGNCGMANHYRLTCTEDCHKCGSRPYCGHLVEVEDNGRMRRIPVCEHK